MVKIDFFNRSNTQRIVVIGAHLAVLIVWFPMLLNRQYFMDWVNSYWLILATQNQPFPQWNFGKVYGLIYLEPWYKYYGNYLYFLMGRTGTIAERIGISTLLVYRIAYVLIVQINLLAVRSLAKRIGINQVIAAMIGAIYVCNPYMVSIAFGRGAFSEFVSTGLFVPIIALIATIYKSKSTPFYIYFLLSGSLTLLFTIHVITIINLTLFFLLALIAFIPFCWRFTLRRMRSCECEILLTTLSACLFSTPMLLVFFLGNKFQINKSLNVDTSLSGFIHIFWPMPKTPNSSTTPGLKTQVLGALLAWSLVVFVSKRKEIRYLTRKIILPLMLILLFTILLIVNAGIWNHLPYQFSSIQFSYRFITFSNLVILILAGVAGKIVSREVVLRSKATIMMFLLILLATYSLGGSAYQTYSAESKGTEVDMTKIDGSKLPPTWYAIGDYRKVGSVEVFASLNFIIERQTSNYVSGWLVCDQHDPLDYVQLPIASSYWQEVRGLDLIDSSINGQIVGKTAKCVPDGTVYIQVKSGSGQKIYRGIVILCFVFGFINLMFVIQRKFWRNNTNNSMF